MQFELPTKKQLPLPIESLHEARVSNVVNLGEKDTPWGRKRQLFVEFTILDEKGPDGGELKVRKYFGNSLHKKSAFFAFVSLLFDGQVPKAFSSEHILNRKVRIFTANSEPDKDGIVWAQVAKILGAAQ